MKKQNFSKRKLITASKNSTRYVSDLITPSEQTISSQATVYSRKSSNMQYTQQTNKSSQMQDDLVGPQLESAFINEKQQKVIKQILQISRKGKINRNNAFQIPIKVANTKSNEITTGKFWKFASQLLDTSINIYGKRIQNTYTNSCRIRNKMSNLSTQFKNDNQQEFQQQQQQQQSKHSKRKQLIKTNIHDIMETNLEKINFGKSTLQSKQKIDILNLNSQFKSGFITSNQLQLFDFNTLDSLFLNLFKTNQNIELQFCNHNNKLQLHPPSIDTSDMNLQSLWKNIDQINMSKCEIFTNLTKFTDANIPTNQISWKKDKIRDFGNSRVNEIINNFHPQGAIQENKFDQYTSGLDTAEQDLEVHSQPLFNLNNDKKIQALSNNQDNNYFSDMFNPYEAGQDQDNFNLTMMTPWQLQFQNLKLKKKRVKSNHSKNITHKTKTKVQQNLIDFDPNVTEQKQLVLRLNKNLNPTRNSQDFDQIKYGNTVPMDMTPFFLYRKRNRTFSNRTNNQYKQKKLSNIQSQYDNDLINNIDPNQHFTQAWKNQSQETKLEQVRQEILQVQSKPYVSKQQRPYRNIGKMKQDINQLLKKDGKISIHHPYLSSLGLSYQSLLVTFLYIMNQQACELEISKDETDAILYLK